MSAEPKPAPRDATSPERRWVRTLVASLLVVVALAAAATARVVWAGEKEVVKSTEALEKGDADDAIVHARAAALWYAPGAPHVRVAYARLMTIAKEAEQRKLWETALFAYRAIVTASKSTQWVTTPHAAEADEATRAIARIEAKTGVRAPEASTEPTNVIEQRILTSLAEDTRPSFFFRAVLGASFIGMLIGLASFMRFGVDESGRVRLVGAVPALVAAILGLVGYCAALFLA
ncbi:MAG: hypothetical protein HOW73_50800 [Polyangiaceae bacterium]|nr:hypothetical protein [Polyangiaceae bacterium]